MRMPGNRAFTATLALLVAWVFPAQSARAWEPESGAAPLEAVFLDGFESGGICAWSGSAGWPDARTIYPDADGDGFGAAGPTQSWPVECPPPAGWTETAGDCDDTDFFTHPGAVEICDGADNDCDAVTDDGCAWCSPVDPTVLCGASSHCTPQVDSLSICSRPAGAGTQGQPCSSLADCAEPFACADPGTGLRCLRWCQLPLGSCAGGAVCLPLSPPVYTGAIEWGLCV